MSIGSGGELQILLAVSGNIQDGVFIEDIGTFPDSQHLAGLIDNHMDRLICTGLIDPVHFVAGAEITTAVDQGSIHCQSHFFSGRSKSHSIIILQDEIPTFPVCKLQGHAFADGNIFGESVTVRTGIFRGSDHCRSFPVGKLDIYDLIQSFGTFKYGLGEPFPGSSSADFDNRFIRCSIDGTLDIGKGIGANGVIFVAIVHRTAIGSRKAAADEKNIFGGFRFNTADNGIGTIFRSITPNSNGCSGIIRRRFRCNQRDLIPGNSNFSPIFQFIEADPGIGETGNRILTHSHTGRSTGSKLSMV